MAVVPATCGVPCGMPTPATAPRRRLLAAGPLFPALMAAAPLLAFAVRVLVQRPDLVFGTDQALIELATGEAAHGARFEGPYSRFGWHHPGPAWFYLLAVPYRLLGSHSWSLVAANALFQAAAVAAVVWVAHRHGGRALALLTAALLLLYVRSAGLDLFIFPWNPWALFLPLCLLLVLGASDLGAPVTRLAWMAVVGSLLVQTHVGVAPVVAAVTAAAAVAAFARRGPGDRRRRPGRGFAAAAVVLAALWVPPLVDQAVHEPGNLSRLARWAAEDHDGPGFPEALQRASSDLARFPSAAGDYVDGTEDFPAAAPVALVGYVALAAGLVVVGLRRRDRFAWSAGLLTLVALPVAVVTITNIAPPVFDYLHSWVSVLPLPLWIAAGAVVLGRAGAAAEPRIAVGLVVLVVPLAVLVARPLVDGTVSVPGNDTVAGVWALVEPQVQGAGGDGVLVRIAEHERWPVATGLVLQLTKHGERVAVTEDRLYMFGARQRPTGDEAVEIVLDVAGAAPQGGDAGASTLLGEVDGTAVWVRKLR